MAEKQSAKKKKKSVFSIFVMGWVIFMLIHAFLLQPKIIANRQEIGELEAQLEYQKLKTEEIERMKADVDTDEYVEKYARENLNLVKPNEIIFVDKSTRKKNN